MQVATVCSCAVFEPVQDSWCQAGAAELTSSSIAGTLETAKQTDFPLVGFDWELIFC